MRIRPGEVEMKLFEFVDNKSLSLETHNVRAHILGLKATILAIEETRMGFNIDFEYDGLGVRNTYFDKAGDITIAVKEHDK